VHPFWLSHEEKQHWLRPSMKGTAMAGVGAPWEAMGELVGEEREGEGQGGEGGGATRGYGWGWGRHGEWLHRELGVVC
jgi:hypothetical protein